MSTQFVSLTAKRRRKGMIIILCVSVCLSLSVYKFHGKLRTLVAQTSYWQTANYTRNKNNNRLLLKPFGCKVMTIYIAHDYCFQTWEDSWGIDTHLNINATVSWLLLKHCIKLNTIEVVLATTLSTGCKHSCFTF